MVTSMSRRSGLGFAHPAQRRESHRVHGALHQADPSSPLRHHCHAYIHLSGGAVALAAAVQVAPRRARYFVVIGFVIAAVFVGLFGFFAVLFTGRYPLGAQNFLVHTYRYSLRVQAYVGLLTDRYPPFALS